MKYYCCYCENGLREMSRKVYEEQHKHCGKLDCIAQCSMCTTIARKINKEGGASCIYFPIFLGVAIRIAAAIRFSRLLSTTMLVVGESEFPGSWLLY